MNVWPFPARLEHTSLISFYMTNQRILCAFKKLMWLGHPNKKSLCLKVNWFEILITCVKSLHNSAQIRVWMNNWEKVCIHQGPEILGRILTTTKVNNFFPINSTTWRNEQIFEWLKLSKLTPKRISYMNNPIFFKNFILYLKIFPTNKSSRKDNLTTKVYQIFNQ